MFTFFHYGTYTTLLASVPPSEMQCHEIIPNSFPLIW